jgi:hypothetical protein
MQIKFSWDFNSLKQLLPNVIKGSQRRLGEPLLESVKKEISIGKSPVDGETRFRGYSDGYITSIKRGLGSRYGKRPRPVNLNLTGKMLASGTTKPVENGIEVSFKDKKAEYHNDMGAGKSKVIRRLLPTRPGETFSRTIWKKVNKFIQDEIISKAVALANGKR